MALDTTLTDKATGTAANVKAASTPVAATDQALAVGLSPNSVGPVVITTAAQFAAGIKAQNFPAGYLQTTDISRQLFVDDFDSLDVVNRWTSASAGGGVAAAASGGKLTLGTGTTGNGYAYLVSQPSFLDNEPGWIRHAYLIQTEFPVIANSYRFWGAGIPQASPTVAAPIVNGAGFELFTDGKLYAVVYNAGVRTVVQDFSAATGNGKQPTDAGVHDFAVFYRTAIIYYTIDFADAPAATSTFAQLPGVGSLPSLYLAIAGSTPPVSSAVLTSDVMDVSDNAKHHTTIADATFKWRQAKVNAQGDLYFNNDSQDSQPGVAGAVPPAATGIALSAANANLNTGTPTANSTVQLQVNGDNGAAMVVSAISSPVLTLRAQVSLDGGTTWRDTILYDVSTGQCHAQLDNTRPKAFAVGDGYSIKTPCGTSHVRVTVSAYTSGNLTVQLRGNDMEATLVVARNQTSRTYTACYIQAWSSGYALSKALTANTETQIASIWHAATATRQVRIKRVEVDIVSSSVAGVLGLRLVSLSAATTPAGAAITPAPHRSDSPAAESTCLAILTTLGTIVNTVNAAEHNIGTQVATTTETPTDATILYSDQDGQNIEPLTMRAGVGEGYAVAMECVGASTVRTIVRITFSEE